METQKSNTETHFPVLPSAKTGRYIT